jgi:hypothetical protein
VNLEVEASLVQNPALGATMLWSFVNRFFDQTREKQGPLVFLAFPILPMVFHEETVQALSKRRFAGGFHLGLTENRTLTVELQERMESFSRQTLESLNIAFASALITFDKRTGELHPIRRTHPFEIRAKELGDMDRLARRLGFWFATTPLDQLCTLLRIRF